MKGCNKKRWRVQKYPILLQNMQILGFKVHEILYIECVGVPIMFQDDLLTYKVVKNAYRMYHEDHSAASSKQTENHLNCQKNENGA